MNFAKITKEQQAEITQWVQRGDAFEVLCIVNNLLYEEAQRREVKPFSF